jgi:phosphatidylethanolamine/phosphatidyl-N-methylethanolamine N-methyltransferase
MLTPPRLGELAVFVAAALRRPDIVGAITPSSRPLAGVLSSVVPRAGRPTVVELGAGTGAVSASISLRLPPAGRHLAVELDPVLAEHLRRTEHRMQVLHGDAAELDVLLRGAEVTSVDAVVSGLPWSIFDHARQRRILRQVCRALSAHGGFTTFAYRHATSLAGARRFRTLLHEHFDQVVITRTVWRNLPPALVYVCHRPLVLPGAGAGTGGADD